MVEGLPGSQSILRFFVVSRPRRERPSRCSVPPLPPLRALSIFLAAFFLLVSDGSVIGSASLRRQAQLLRANPTFKVVNFRGNVQTRLRKLDEEIVDGESSFLSCCCCC